MNSDEAKSILFDLVKSHHLPYNFILDEQAIDWMEQYGYSVSPGGVIVLVNMEFKMFKD